MQDSQTKLELSANEFIQMTPGDFSMVIQPDGKTTSPFLSIIATSQVIRDTTEILGITEWHLYKLMGLRFMSNGYAWTSGNKRPGSGYLTRLVKLYQIHFGGTPLASIEEIDWDDGEIYLKELNGKRNQSNVHNRRQQIASGRSGRQTAVSAFRR